MSYQRKQILSTAYINREQIAENRIPRREICIPRRGIAVSRRGIAISRRGTDLGTSFLKLRHYVKAVSFLSEKHFVPIFRERRKSKRPRREAQGQGGA